VKPRLHTHTEYGPRFHPLLHSSYIRDDLSAPLSENFFSRIMSGKKANNKPELCHVKRQKKIIRLNLKCLTMI
jgi:hypothetical protein